MSFSNSMKKITVKTYLDFAEGYGYITVYVCIVLDIIKTLFE